MNTRHSTFLVFAISGLFVSTAVAQPPGGGPRGPGGRQAEMLRRMDANGDGILQTEEIPERARPFLRAAAERAGLNPDQPMPIDKMTPSDDRRGESDGDRRGRRGDDRGREGRRGDDRDREGRRGDDRGREGRRGRWGRDDNEDRPRYKPNNDPTTVRGFGEPLSHPPVSGFDVPPSSAGGTASKTDAQLEAIYTRRVVQFVDEGILGRYDKNKNKVLDPDEWEDVRWRSDPNEFDTDQDARLTREELMIAFAKRFGVEPKPIESTGSAPTQASRDSGRQSSSRESASAGKKVSASEKIREYARSLIKKYDKNSDGILDESELEAVSGTIKKSDLDGDGRVTRDELVTSLTDRAKADNPGQRGTRSSSRPSSQSANNPVRAGIVRSAHERLPEGLPSWFRERDANRDGQVEMHEYTSRWSEREVGEFKRYDPNGDGLITPEEAQRGKR